MYMLNHQPKTSRTSFNEKVFSFFTAGLKFIFPDRKKEKRCLQKLRTVAITTLCSGGSGYANRPQKMNHKCHHLI